MYKSNGHNPSWLPGLLASLCVMVSCTGGWTIAGELVLDKQFGLQQLESMPRALDTSVQCEPTKFEEFDAVQWQVWLRADSAVSQPLQEDVRSADFVIRFPTSVNTSLHWSKGSHAEESDFQPQVRQLNDSELKLESFGGRSSDGTLPMFNLAVSDSRGEQGGVIIAIGWSGDWQASFQQLDASHVRVRAGLKKCRFRMQPNEQLLLPSILVMSYRGRSIDGQNKLRRLMMKHFTPQNHPATQLMPVAASVHGMLAFNDTSEVNLKALAKDIAKTKLPLDTLWLDAGWNEGGFPGGQGNYLPDAKRFPNGLAPIGAAAQQEGMRFLMWFEPERAMRGSWLEQQHPEWLLNASRTPPELRYMEKDGFRLLDLGNSAARQWALDIVSKEITQSHVSIYRQDFNEYPAYFWHTNEAEDAIGLREVRYINGLYDFLDRLRQRHPALIIDNCASGGRRLDIAMMTRSVCLWRSDSCWDAKGYPRNAQAMTHGLSLWLPLHGLGSVATDSSSLRSGMGACASFAINYRDSESVNRLGQHLRRYLPIRHLYSADFYPLTPWSLDPTQWLAFQFHDPKSGQGVVQAFHGSVASESRIALKLEGLEADASYLLTDWDDGDNSVTVKGSKLMSDGIEVGSTANKNEARVWEYKHVVHVLRKP